MSKTLTLVVPDEVALDLDTNDEVEILEVHEDGPDAVEEKQAELKERMALDPADDEGDDSKEEAELADLQRDQLKDFIHRERRDGISK